MYSKQCRRCGHRYSTKRARQRVCDTCRTNQHKATKHQARNARAWANRVKICRCGAPFEARNPRKLLCGECDRAENDARENHEMIFVGIDGEGQAGKCQACDCPQYSGNDPEICECGHPILPTPGQTIGHEHIYVLLGCGDKQIENPAGLTLPEMFSFLYKQFDPSDRTVYVGYFLAYDFTRWLCQLPENRAKILLSKEGIAKRKRRRARAQPFPVLWHGWEFDILGFKRLKFRPRICTCAIAGCEHFNSNPNKWMWINDAGPFFQMSLLKVLDPAKWIKPIVSPEEYATLEKGKSARGNSVLDDDMRFYNRLENEVLARLMTDLNHGLVSLGVRLKKNQWFGPGQAAQAWLHTQNECPNRATLESLVPNQAIESARKSYYGGWFEIPVHGIVPGTSWEADINNAYPYVISKLPCLLHGRWKHRNRHGETRELYPSVLLLFALVAVAAGWLAREHLSLPGRARETVRLPLSLSIPHPATRDEKRAHEAPTAIARTLPEHPADGLRLVYANVKGSDPHIGTMLHRDLNRSILRPDSTRGWYWQHEIDAAIRAGLIDDTEYWEWIDYDPCDCAPPLQKMAELYDYRLSVGKNTSVGKAIKLIVCSGYGKFAQQQGDNPVFANWIYSSLITAGCRTMILDAIATHPEGTSAVVMIATDGIYFRSPHPSLPASDKLGEWEIKERENLTLFKPGVYWDDAAREAIALGHAPEFKTRGINANAFSGVISDIDRQFAEWDSSNLDSNQWPAIELPVSFAMTTCMQALARNKWFLAGHVTRGKMKHTSDPSAKRAAGYYDAEAGLYRSVPIMQNQMNYYGHYCALASIPYGKKDSENARTVDAEMTQWVSPDGYERAIFTEVLGQK